MLPMQAIIYDSIFVRDYNFGQMGPMNIYCDPYRDDNSQVILINKKY